MLEAEIQYRAPEVLAELTRLAGERLQAAANLLADALRAAVGVPYPPASRPGEPPRRRTGRGQAGITVWVTTDGEAYVGVLDAPYMLVHDRTLRPWVLPTLRRVRGRLAAVLERG